MLTHLNDDHPLKGEAELDLDPRRTNLECRCWTAGTLHHIIVMYYSSISSFVGHGIPISRGGSLVSTGASFVYIKDGNF